MLATSSVARPEGGQVPDRLAPPAGCGRPRLAVAGKAQAYRRLCPIPVAHYVRLRLVVGRPSYTRTMSASFQEIIMRLNGYWAERGCLVQEPYDVEVGAGTMAPATFLRV